MDKTITMHMSIPLLPRRMCKLNAFVYGHNQRQVRAAVWECRVNDVLSSFSTSAFPSLSVVYAWTKKKGLETSKQILMGLTVSIWLRTWEMEMEVGLRSVPHVACPPACMSTCLAPKFDWSHSS